MEDARLALPTIDNDHRTAAELFPPSQNVVASLNDNPLREVHRCSDSAIASVSPVEYKASSMPVQTILSVEDNDDLRQVMEIFLDMVGYRVISRRDPASASEDPTVLGQIDLLLTDLEMPGRSGVQLARELTTLRPSLPVIVVSGSLISGELTEEMRDRNWTFLAKPFAFPTLLAAIQAFLQTPQRQAA